MAADANVGIIDIFDRDLLDIIPAEVIKKVELVWNEKVSENFRIQVEKEKIKSSLEQQNFSLEREIVKCKEQLQEEVELKDNLDRRLKECQVECSSNHEIISKLHIDISVSKEQIERFQSEKSLASSESDIIAGNLDVLNRKIKELEKENTALQENLLKASKEKCEALIRAENCSVNEVSSKYKCQLVEKDRSLLEQQIKILNQQLEERIQECLKQSRDQSSNFLNLQSELGCKTEEIRILKDEREHYNSQYEEAKKRVNELLSALNEAQEVRLKIEESFQEDLASHKKLINIYEASGEEMKKRCEEHEKTVDEIKKFLQEASDEYGALQRAKIQSEEEAHTSLDSANALIKELKAELDRANNLLETSQSVKDSSDEVTPTILKLKRKGLSLTQVFSEYMTTSEKLLECEDENQSLKRYIEEIMEEVEERTPILRKQKEDYEKTLEDNMALLSRLELTFSELDKLKTEFDESKRKLSYFERENKRLKTTEKDLSRQVSVLIAQVEAARTGLPPPTFDNGVESDKMNGSINGADDVITKHLVSFRDITELQENNRKLIAALREASDKDEAAERESITLKTQELQVEIHKYKSELEELKAARERQELLVEGLIKQRDSYKLVLSQKAPHILKSSSPNSSAFGMSQYIESENESLKKELDSVKQQIIEIEKEKCIYREEKEKHIKLIEDEQKCVKQNLDKLRIENTKLLSQAVYDDERLKVLRSNNEILQKQIKALETKNNTLQDINTRHEQMVQTVRAEHMAQLKKLAQLEVTVRHLKEEKQVFKETEARLVAENESCKKFQVSLSLILTSLEIIKNNQESYESEMGTRYTKEIKELTEQCRRLKSKLESNSEIIEAQTKLKLLENAKTVLEQENNDVKKQLTEKTNEIATLYTRLNTSPPERRQSLRYRGRGGKQTPGDLPSLSPDISSPKEIATRLHSEIARNSNLQLTISQLRKNIDELKKMNEDYEQRIKDINSVHEALLHQNEEINGEKQKIIKDMTDMKQENLMKQNSWNVEKAKLEEEIAEIRNLLCQSELQVSEISVEMEKLKSASDEAHRNAQEHIKLSSEVQEKYEREVMLHGVDLQALASLKEKLSSHNAEMQALLSAKIKAEEALDDLKITLKNHEEKLKDESSKISKRNSELEKENATLLEQFTDLSEKLAVLQSKLIPPGDSVSGINTSLTEEDAHNIEHMREVIKYLRKDREALSTKCVILQAESQRLEAARKSLDLSISQMNIALAEEKAKNETTFETSVKYNNMFKKVQAYDAMADSNRLLREEHESVKTNLIETEAKLRALGVQIEPIHQKLQEANARVENVEMEKKCLENEKDMYKKRSADLVEKLNRTKPEEFLRLQQELGSNVKSLKAMDIELSRLKNQVNQLQKSHQLLLQSKIQCQQQATQAKEELKKVLKEKQKLIHEKTKMVNDNQETIKNIETTFNEERNQLQQQILDSKQKEEVKIKEIDSVKMEYDAKFKKLEEDLRDKEEKRNELETRNVQLRKIAQKYKTASENVKNVPGLEEDQGPAEKVKQLEDTISSLRQQIQKNTEAQPVQSEDVPKLASKISELENKMSVLDSELAMKSSILLQLEEKVKSSEETLVKKSKEFEELETQKQALENRIIQLEGFKEIQTKEIEALKQKILHQRHLEKQPIGVSKPSSVSEKTGIETPPTANIKPMAAPVTSARSQTSSQAVLPAKTIPTASIKPISSPSPSSVHSVSQSSSVGVVSPMESHSESSSSGVPQATIAPTPIQSTATLTATVSPTPVTSFISSQSSALVLHPSNVQLASTNSSQFLPQIIPTTSTPVIVAVSPQQDRDTLSADSLISQAIAMVTPIIDQPQDDIPGTSQKRKLELDEEELETEEDKKKSKIEQVCPTIILQTPEDHVMEEGELQSSEHDQDETSQEGAPTDEIQVIEESQEPQFVSEDDGSVEPLNSLPTHETQNSATFGSLTAFDEGGDDSIVPSTPTLPVPQKSDSFSTSAGYSQVPSSGFLFSSGQQGSQTTQTTVLAQMTEGGIIEDTQIDLCLLEETDSVQSGSGLIVLESIAEEPSSTVHEIEEMELQPIAETIEDSSGSQLETILEESCDDSCALVILDCKTITSAEVQELQKESEESIVEKNDEIDITEEEEVCQEGDSSSETTEESQTGACSSARRSPILWSEEKAGPAGHVVRGGIGQSHIFRGARRPFQAQRARRTRPGGRFLRK